jgi:hypothetical protein
LPTTCPIATSGEVGKRIARRGDDQLHTALLVLVEATGLGHELQVGEERADPFVGLAGQRYRRQLGDGKRMQVEMERRPIVPRLRPDSDRQAKADLLTDVKTFDKASRTGEYYESFMVNSRNCTAQSTGTTVWIATCNRLLDRCVADEKKREPAELRAAFDILFGLLDCIDQCNDDVIFFADEGGAWQVGVDWTKVLPSWFRVLSITATPEEYAKKITSLIRHHCDCDREKMLVAASEFATAEQREALARAQDRRARGNSQGRNP